MSESLAPGFKNNKKIISIAIYLNTTGTHKITLFDIGKPIKPLSLKNTNIASLIA